MLGETLHTDGELDEAAKLGQSEKFERIALVLVKKVELGGGRPWDASVSLSCRWRGTR